MELPWQVYISVVSSFVFSFPVPVLVLFTLMCDGTNYESMNLLEKKRTYILDWSSVNESSGSGDVGLSSLKLPHTSLATST